MTNYNGHKSWNAWNVSLWLNNDEGLYNIMLEHVHEYKTKPEAARALHECLIYDFNQTHTPDGAPFTVTNIRAAMVGL